MPRAGRWNHGPCVLFCLLLSHQTDHSLGCVKNLLGLTGMLTFLRPLTVFYCSTALFYIPISTVDKGQSVQILPDGLLTSTLGFPVYFPISWGRDQTQCLLQAGHALYHCTSCLSQFCFE